MSLKGAFGALRDEAVEEIGLTFGKQLFDCFGGELFLEDDLAETEAVGGILWLELGNMISLVCCVEFRFESVLQRDCFKQLIIGQFIG